MEVDGFKRPYEKLGLQNGLNLTVEHNWLVIMGDQSIIQNVHGTKTNITMK